MRPFIFSTIRTQIAKPRPSSAIPPGHGAVGLRKRLKNALLFVLADANAGISDGQMEKPFARCLLFFLDPDHDFSAFGKLNRISHQIDKNLANVTSVAQQRFR
jgi:hypothetical protein